MGFLDYNLSSAIGSVFGPSSESEDAMLLVEARSSILDLGQYQEDFIPGDIFFSGEIPVFLELLGAGDFVEGF
jgi:hypothetical protein